MGTSPLTTQNAKHRRAQHDAPTSESECTPLPVAGHSSSSSALSSPVCEPVAIVSMAMVRSFKMAHPILMHIPPSPKSNTLPSRSHSLNSGSTDSGAFARSAHPAHPKSTMATDTEKAKRRRRALVVHGRVYSDDFMSIPNMKSSSRHQQSFSV